LLTTFLFILSQVGKKVSDDDDDDDEDKKPDKKLDSAKHADDDDDDDDSVASVLSGNDEGSTGTYSGYLDCTEYAVELRHLKQPSETTVNHVRDN
jgi:hypothetical protein